MISVVFGAWAAAALAGADEPAAPRTPNPADAALLDGKMDQLLRTWHERTQKIDTLWIEFQRTSKDTVFRGETKRDGVAVFKKPNLARMNIFQEVPAAVPGAAAKPRQAEEVLILTDRDPEGKPLPRLEVWHYRLDEKKIKIFEVPDDRGQNLQEDGPLKLMFGVNPQTAHGRYDFKIRSRAEGMALVRITPKLAADKDEFLWSEVWLDLNTYLPRRLTVQENNDTQVTYDFPKQGTVNGELGMEYFQPKRVKGFDIVRPSAASAGNAPNAVRPVARKNP